MSVLVAVALIVCGISIAAVFYLGLKMTVDGLTQFKYPGVIFVISFSLRLLFALFGFWIGSSGQPIRLMLIFSGFLLVRLVMLTFQKFSPTVRYGEGANYADKS